MTVVASATWELVRPPANAAEEARLLSELSSVVPSYGLGARFLNLEWKLGPVRDWSTLRVYALRSGEEILGVAPFVRQQRPLDFFFGEFKLASAGLTRHTLIGDVYIDSKRGQEAQLAAANALLQRVVSELGPREAIYFEGLPCNSHMYRLLMAPGDASGTRIVLRLGKPFDHQFIELPDTYDAYVRSLGGRSRQSVQYSQRRLSRDMDGDVLIRRFDSPGSVREFVQHASSVSRKTYQWQLLGLGLRDDSETLDSLSFAAERNWFCSYLMYCRGKPCAFMLGHLYGNCYYYDDVGYDPEFAKWSVGSVLQLEVLKDLLARTERPAYFDFSTGFGEHKGRFGNLSRTEENILVLRGDLRSRALMQGHKTVDAISGAAVGLLDRVGLKQRIKKLVRRSSSG